MPDPSVSLALSFFQSLGIGGVGSTFALKKNRAITNKTIAPQPRYWAMACL